MGNRLGGLFERWFGREGNSAATEPLSEETAGVLRESRRSITREAVTRTETLRWILPDGNDETATVEVEDDSDLGVRVKAPAGLAVGQTVWLTLCGDVEKCVVRHCRPLGGGYTMGLYRIRNERRREDREVVAGKAELFWGGMGAEIRHLEVDVRDVSAAGMQVLTSRPIPPQTAVRVTGQDYACIGVTCYCRPEDERYAVGIQFTQDPYFKEGAEYDD